MIKNGMIFLKIISNVIVDFRNFGNIEFIMFLVIKVFLKFRPSFINDYKSLWISLIIDIITLIHDFTNYFNEEHANFKTLILEVY